MTAVEALKRSIEMWTWIRDLRLKTKEEYFLSDMYPPHCYCYLCEYAKDKDKCLSCPVKNWGNGSKYCYSEHSVYSSFNDNQFDYSKNQGIHAYEISYQMLVVLEQALQEHLEGEE